MTLPKLKNHLQSPARYSWVNHKGHPDGSALDLGWRTGKPESKNQPLYSPGEMKVLDVSYFNDAGNNIVLGAQYNDEQDIWVGIGHMKEASIRKVGEILGREDVIGHMGNTGTSAGEHAHIRVSLVPTGMAFSWKTFNAAKRQKPLDFIFATEDMDVIDMKKMPAWNKGPEEETGLKYKVGDKVKVKGTLYGNSAMGNPGAKINKEGKVSIIAKGAKAPYHIDSLGWVTIEAVGEVAPAPTPAPKPTPTPSKKKIMTNPGRVYLYSSPDMADRNRYPMPITKRYEVTLEETVGAFHKVTFASNTAVNPKTVWIRQADTNTTTTSSNVGRFANLKGTVVLYKEKNGNRYPVASGKNRSRKIVEEGTAMVKIEWGIGGASHVWVNKKDITITGSALYSTKG